VNVAALLRERRPDTGSLPRYLVATRTGDTSVVRFAHTDAELTAIRVETERTLQTSIDLAATQVRAYHRNAAALLLDGDLPRRPAAEGDRELAPFGFTAEHVAGTTEPFASIVEASPKRPSTCWSNCSKPSAPAGARGEPFSATRAWAK